VFLFLVVEPKFEKGLLGVFGGVCVPVGGLDWVYGLVVYL
jgi:hypothetical protein